MCFYHITWFSTPALRGEIAISRNVLGEVFLFFIVYMISVRESYRGFVGGVQKNASPVRCPDAAGGRVCEIQATTKYKLQRPRIYQP